MKHPRNPVKPMISYFGSSSCIPDQQVIDQLTTQLKNSDAENFREFLKLFPPIKQLIRGIPNTLCLLDIIVTKSLKFHKSSSSKAALHHQELFNQLLWWIAYNEQTNIQQNETSKSTDGKNKASRVPGNQLQQLEGWEKYVRSILAAIQTDSPHIIEAARCAELRFADGLEALGCHGLVNCSNGLISLLNAVRLEIANHHKNVKGISTRLRCLKSNKHQFGVPSGASHHRQVNSRLSQIYVRLSENKRIKDFLVKSLTNVHLSSLLRIVRRRLICDQTLIKLFRVLSDSAPPDYMLSEVDPIAANVIATFQIAHHKLLSLVSQEFSTSINSDYLDPAGCDDECRFLLSASDTNTETDVSATNFLPSELLTNTTSFTKATKKTDRDSSSHNIPQHMTEVCHQHQEGSGRAQRINPDYLAKKTSRLGTAKTLSTVSHHQSLNDLNSCHHYNGKHSFRPAKSMNCLEYAGSRAESRHRGCLLPDGSSQTADDDDLIKRLKLKVKRLHNELRETQKEIRCMARQDEKEQLVEKVSQEKDPSAAAVTDTKGNDNYATQEEISALVKKFANLYEKDRAEILVALDELPEFCGSTELQYKTIISTIVLTYRSVQESANRRRQLIFEILGDQLLDDRDSQNLDIALYRYMSRKAKYEHGIANAKEVTSQIWNALYDFPSLRTCTIFNKFILDCVAVAWDLVAGIDGKPPRMCIEYEIEQFDIHKHQRFVALSNIHSSTIQQYLWPAIIDKSSGTCLHKAIVIT